MSSQTGLVVEHRASESPYIERVWRSRSHDVGQMLAVANPRVGLVSWCHRGKLSVSITGPESGGSRAEVPEDATFFGIDFALGAFLPHLSGTRLLDREISIPDVSDRSFHLAGSHWQHPDFDTAELFVQRLVREEILGRDRLITDIARGATPDLSARTVQRRFLAATGVTRGAARQMDRARAAAIMLGDGAAPAEVIIELGFHDNPHLHRSLRRYIGRTATELSSDAAVPLSLLYTTDHSR
ncbi:helix-turn-helix domain-containing protein [Microlunatus speluncae]|uniref:helix-turn-helix domain-containing protein n=1 Tax=Microlunatus speluncae TaxID=2594267 RepID=UPI001FE2B74D|nr:helix-turn-helix domain-containing protein [Microlunatus speluncae]